MPAILSLAMVAWLQMPYSAPSCLNCPTWSKVPAVVERVGAIQGILFRNCEVLVSVVGSNKLVIVKASATRCGLLQKSDKVTIIVWQGGGRIAN